MKKVIFQRSNEVEDIFRIEEYSEVTGLLSDVVYDKYPIGMYTAKELEEELNN